MQIQSLGSENTAYYLADVFEPEIFQQLADYCESFKPNFIRLCPDGNFRETAPLDRRLNRLIETKWSHQLRQLFDYEISLSSEVWRDYPGYSNGIHVDDPVIDHVLMVYLNQTASLDHVMGTEFIESDGAHYHVPNVINHGLLLLNSPQIPHGMVGQVPANHVRKTFYINIQRL